MPRVRASTTQYGVVKFAEPGKSGPGLVISSEDPRIKALTSTNPQKPFVLPKHASTHRKGGTDFLRLDELADPQDNTKLDATPSVHGLMSKADKAKLDGLSASGKLWIRATLPDPSLGNNDDGALVLEDLGIYFKTGGTWTIFGYVMKAVSDSKITVKTPTAGDGTVEIATL